jgi:MFS family permease
VIARDEFKLGAGGYGMLLGVFGAGAVAGAVSIPRTLQRLSLNRLVSAGVLVFAIATVLVAATPMIAIAIIGVCAAGAAWVSVLASLSAGTQSSAPAWVRARALATNLVAMQASLAAGSAIWGTLATITSIRIALAAAAALMLLLLVLNRHVRVALGNEADMKPGVQLPELAVTAEPDPDDGPVLIQIEYRIAPGNREAFLRAIHATAPTRQRNGASAWRLFHDLEDDERFVERFVIRSWAEYVRLRLRFTLTENELQERVVQLQRPDVPIQISRLLGVDPRDVDPPRRKSGG